MKRGGADERHRTLLLIGALALAGCMTGGPREPLSSAPVELTAVPFHAQQAYHCGPAALATVLQASGVNVHPDALAPSLFIPERQGTLQVELLAAARRRGRLPVQIAPALTALVAQLEAGRPVLVLQNLGARLYPVWHYAVVVGYLPAEDRLVLRSGEQQRLLVGRGRFDRTWQRADRWGFVALAPDTDPEGLQVDAYLAAAADLENVGSHVHALGAFRSAVARWPDAALARLGEANNLYYLGRPRAAEAAYRLLLAEHPGQVVGVHNLTMLLLEAGRPCEARAVLEAASGLSGALIETARRSAAAAAADCPQRQENF